jgi:hypothetical protein
MMTYACPACKFMIDISRLNFSVCKTRFTASLAIFQLAVCLEIYTGLSDCHVLTIISQNYAGSEQKSICSQHRTRHSPVPECKGFKVAGIRVDGRTSD